MTSEFQYGLASAAICLICGLLFIPQYIRFAKGKSIVDIPNHRSSHTSITPRGGGIVLTITSFIASLLFVLSYGSGFYSLILISTAALVAFVGLIDDLKPLPSFLRLTIHIAAASVLCWILIEANFQFHILPKTLPKYEFAFAICVIWLVGSLNIYNFMDGIDGIACTQGLCSAAVWSYIGFTSSDLFIGVVALTLIGGLLALLKFNWSPAKVFMGDCSSGFLGFTYAAFPIHYAASSDIDLWFCLNLGALSLFPFLLDGSFTLTRRILNGENPTEAHRSHLYQRFAHRKSNHPLTTLIYGSWAALSGMLTILVHAQTIGLLTAYLVAVIPGATLAFFDMRFQKRDAKWENS